MQYPIGVHDKSCMLYWQMKTPLKSQLTGPKSRAHRPESSTHHPSGTLGIDHWSNWTSSWLLRYGTQIFLHCNNIMELTCFRSMVIPAERHVVWALRKAKSEQDGGASMILVFSRWYFRFLKDIVSLYVSQIQGIHKPNDKGADNSFNVKTRERKGSLNCRLCYRAINVPKDAL